MQIEQAEQREVYIEVLGGVAHIVSAPDDVDVYIIDLDETKESWWQVGNQSTCVAISEG